MTVASHFQASPAEQLKDKLERFYENFAPHPKGGRSSIDKLVQAFVGKVPYEIHCCCCFISTGVGNMHASKAESTCVLGCVHLVGRSTYWTRS